MRITSRLPGCAGWRTSCAQGETPHSRGHDPLTHQETTTRLEARPRTRRTAGFGLTAEAVYERAERGESRQQVALLRLKALVWEKHCTGWRPWMSIQRRSPHRWQRASLPCNLRGGLSRGSYAMAAGTRHRRARGCLIASAEETGILQLLPQCLPDAWLSVSIWTTPSSKEAEIPVSGTTRLPQADWAPKIRFSGDG